MSDLISRSDTMKRLRDYAEQKHYNGEVELANGILKAVCFIEHEENIPTAYDVNAVVKEIEKLERPNSAEEWFANVKLRKAIKAVKKGGIIN